MWVRFRNKQIGKKLQQTNKQQHQHPVEGFGTRAMAALHSSDLRPCKLDSLIICALSTQIQTDPIQRLGYKPQS